MRNLKYILISVILLVAITIHGQSYKSSYTPENVVYLGDTLILEVPSYYGNIQWQASPDMTNWLNIPDANIGEQKIIADSAAYYRAEVLGGNCDPVFSDTLFVTPRNFLTADVSLYSEWDELLLLYDGRYILVKDTLGIPQTIFYKPKLDHPGYVFYCDSLGLPEKMIIDSVIVLFSNYRDSLVDIAIIDSSDSIYIFKDLEHDLQLNQFLSSLGSTKKSYDKAKTLKYAAWIANGLSCGIGLAGLPTGVGAILVGISCATFIYEIDELFFDNVSTPVEDISMTGLGFVSTAYSCLIKVNVLECYLESASLVTDLMSISEEYSNKEQSIIDAALEQLKGGNVKDVDGNTYKTVTIGTQVWMAENLKTTKFNDKTNIPNVKDSTAWAELLTPGFCWNNNDPNNKVLYGALYNWYTVNTGNICPMGWHVPTDAEWKTLEMHLGMPQSEIDIDHGNRGTDEGIQLKNTSGWDSGGNGTNISGFSALPSANRTREGTFNIFGIFGAWWSSTEDFPNGAWYRFLCSCDNYVSRYNCCYQHGLSVRCLKDE